MKTFPQYREYLEQQLKHVLINNEADLLSFTKFLLNYGKVALKYFPEEVEKLAHQSGIYGIKETELLNLIISVEFKDKSVIIKTADKKLYTTTLKSSAEILSRHQGIDLLDLLLLLSVTLDNKKQELFQIVNLVINKKTK